MNKIAIFIFIFSIVAINFAAEYLLEIDHITAKDRNQYRIIRQLGTQYLVLANDFELHSLKQTRFSFKNLDIDPQANLYLLVGKSREDEKTIVRYGTKLSQYDNCFLLKTTESAIPPLKRLQIEIDRIVFDVITYDNEPESEPVKFEKAQRNPIIEKILESISLDTMRANIRKLQSFATRRASTNTNKTEVCPWLKKVMENYCDSVFFEDAGSNYGPNIIGIRKGIDNPSLTNYCLIGGHLDAVPVNGKFNAAGADDNASGTAATMECARVFSKFKFENTIRFVLFNAEEVGIVGSKKLVKNMKNAGHTLIGGAVTLDMIGHSSVTENTVILEGTTQVPGCDTFINKFLQSIVNKYTQLETYVDLNGFGSDHTSFWPQEYIAILLIEKDWDKNGAYHLEFDTLDCPVGLNDNKLMIDITKVALAAIADLAVPKENTDITGYHPLSINDINVRVKYLINNQVCFTISSHKYNKVSAEIFNTQGRLIHSQIKSTAGKGDKQIFIWDFNNLKREKSSDGLYVIQFNIGNQKLAHKLLLF